MADTAKIPTTVITGFLGAGKTTLIRRLIERADRRIALIVNEFGDVGIDGDILKACGSDACGAEDIVELSNGCICCTVADDFMPTMTALLDRPNPPEHIVVETSGLALPQPLVRAFNWPAIRTRVTVDGVITVVDGEALAAGRVATDLEALKHQRADDQALDHDNPIEEVFEDQLAAADLVVVSKIDLLDEAQRAAVIERLEPALRPGVSIVAASHGEIPLAVLIGLGARAESDLAARIGHHGEDEEHDHDDFASVIVELGSLADRPAFEEAARQAVADNGLLRLKGFAAVDGADMRLLVQGVGPRVETWFDTPFLEDEPRTTRLVAIGPMGIDAGRIARAFEGTCIS